MHDAFAVAKKEAKSAPGAFACNPKRFGKPNAPNKREKLSRDARTCSYDW